jgi:hypothetical protein
MERRGLDRSEDGGRGGCGCVFLVPRRIGSVKRATIVIHLTGDAFGCYGWMRWV